MADDIHDDGVQRPFDRRYVLRMAGVLGVAALVGCSDDDASSSGTSTTTRRASRGAGTTTTRGADKPDASSTTAVASGDCDQIPEETAGPFPGDGTNGPDALTDDGVVRRDIRSSFGSSETTAEGIPLTIYLRIRDTTASCGSLAGAAVYVWHCDRVGRYSMYSDGVEDENYLRGLQETDRNGLVTFDSIYPGCYAGRWPHIHFEVYESMDAATGGGTRIATSQVALPWGASREAYDAAGYEQSITNLADITLQDDMVFGDDDGASQTGEVLGSPAEGYTVDLTVGVDSTFESGGGAGLGPGDPGPGPGAGPGKPPGTPITPPAPAPG